MQVVACGATGDTRLERRPEPVPGQGDLVLAVRVCGFCGTDLFKLDGKSVPEGTVLGHEVVGVVTAVGAGVTGFAEGDRVVVPHHVPCRNCAFCRGGSETMCPTFRENLLEPGGFSERILVRQRAVALAAKKVPDDVRDEAAVFFEPAACVLRGVRSSGLRDGGVAVVLGAGSMGLLHVLVLRAVFPALKIFATDPVSERRRLAEDLGADAAWAPETARQELHERTDGVGADAIFDTVGGTALLDEALRLGRRGSAVVLFAHARPGDRAGFDLNWVFKEERRVLGTYSGALREQQEIYDLIVARRLDASPLVTDRLPFSRFGEAVERARSQRALKVLLYPGP